MILTPFQLEMLTFFPHRLALSSSKATASSKLAPWLRNTSTAPPKLSPTSPRARPRTACLRCAPRSCSARSRFANPPAEKRKGNERDRFHSTVLIWRFGSFPFGPRFLSTSLNGKGEGQGKGFQAVGRGGCFSLLSYFVALSAPVF